MNEYTISTCPSSVVLWGSVNGGASSGSACEGGGGSGGTSSRCALMMSASPLCIIPAMFHPSATSSFSASSCFLANLIASLSLIATVLKRTRAPGGGAICRWIPGGIFFGVLALMLTLALIRTPRT